MPTPFTGYSDEAGQRRLLDALERQQLICNDTEAIRLIAQEASIEAYEPDEIIISQNGDDDDLFFILEGSTRICAQKRTIRVRAARTHVGEMAMIDPEAGRSADVIARERCVVARMTGARTREIADSSETKLWRSLARSLADRLREHTAAVREQNAFPHIFIGSTSESLPVAEALKRGLVGDWSTVAIWNDPDIFAPSQTAIESLEDAIRHIDFAVLVAGDDDWTTSRSKRQASPRDNMVFEIGLAMGALGRDRTFIVTPNLPRGKIKWPSDLFGLNLVMFNAPSAVLPSEELTKYSNLTDTDSDAMVAEAVRTLVTTMTTRGPY